MSNPNFLLPLLRPFLPKWWADRIALDDAVECGKILRREWDAAQGAAFAPAVVFLADLSERLEHVVFWTFDERVPEENRVDEWERERAALLALAGLCLARLAALPKPEDR